MLLECSLCFPGSATASLLRESPWCLRRSALVLSARNWDCLRLKKTRLRIAFGWLVAGAFKNVSDIDVAPLYTLDRVAT